MNIKSAKYVKHYRVDSNDSITITQQDDSLLSVPLDPANTDYQAILLWAAIDGNSIVAAD